MTRYRLYLTFVLLLWGAGFAAAQVAPERFGKNRIQYKNFNWQFYSSDNFDIYFYEGGKDNALIAAKYLEKEFERITDIIGYAPYSKTKIFLYNSPQDLQQSNVGVRGDTYTIGGKTNFVKSQVEIAYPGTMFDFRQELVLRISEMLINDMMFGGSLTDMFQSAYLLSLPEWFIEGAARYIAQGWSIEMDDYARELFRDRKNVKISRLSGEEAAIAGQSIWNFVAVRYGRSSISNILNLTRIIRNEESSIVNTLGVPYKLFMRQWQAYYGEMTAQLSDSYVFPDENKRLRRKNRKDYQYNQVAFSPDGRYLAYSENRNGKYKVKILDTERGKERTVLTSGYQLIGQQVDNNVPLLDWGNAQTLGIIGYERGKNILWLYDLNSKKKREIKLRRFNQIKSFDLSDNGRLAVMSADLNGQNDLFMYNPNRNSFRRLTTDLYDDLYPHFMPESERVVFSSNRPGDSLYYASPAPRTVNLNENIDDNFNIFLFDLEEDPNDSLLTQVTKTVSQDIMPLPKDENTLFYLSNQQGIYNLYRYNLTDSLFNQVSNFEVSIQNYALNPKNNSLAFVMLDQDHDYVFLYPDFDFSQNTFTPKTPRQQAIQAQVVAERMANKQRKNTAPAAPTEEPTSVVDTTAAPTNIIDRDTTIISSQEGVVDTDTYQFETTDSLPSNNNYINTDAYTFDTPPAAGEDAVSTDNYAFEGEGEQPASGVGNSFLARYRKLRQESPIAGPFPYETRFSADNVTTSLTMDPLRGFGFHIGVQMNDMLENHRFNGGLTQFADLRSASIFAEYQYLEKRTDFRLRYEREGYDQSEDDRNAQKYTLNRFYAGAALPLNVSTRLEVNPFFANTHYINLGFNANPSPTDSTESTNYYGGIQTGLVFDNSTTTGLNKYEGTRARVFLTHYQGINDQQNSFSNLEIDIRHYQKIHRELKLATRFFYGNFFGSNAQNYLLGGIENALFPRQFDEREENDPLAIEQNVDNSNIVFAEFVNLRGFNFNKFNGSEVLTFSAELRLPIIRYFYQGPIASNFFRNLEFVGFYDAGSAWTGPSPLSRKNSINTEVRTDRGSPFRAEIQNFKNPWLQSYGAGVRTVLLGYYVKFDLAYPVEDNIVGKPRFYLSLGYDF